MYTRDQSVLAKVYVPPMAGVTDSVFRRLTREILGDKVDQVRLSTEMISSKGIIYQNNPKRLRLSEDEVGRVVIQLFGHEPETMAEAARVAEDAGAASIDINMGCPVPKITRGKDGAALMREPELARRIILAVSKAVGLPISVKTRLGWCESSKNIESFAQMLQDAGISSLTIHGRTRAQAYTGQADWEMIAEVNQRLSIPVFVNGDINDPDKAETAIQKTACHGVAVARAAIGNPWLVKRILQKLLGEVLSKEPSLEEKLSAAARHLELAFEDQGERGVLPLKKHLSKYLSGMPNAAQHRTSLSNAANYQEMKRALAKIHQESLQA
ncbi:MAG: tRNA dihydrouridine synthase DusB [Candidatus Caenarcaniphilales bacterium]|nr:tRNA dihydrouridine synthase DusB [Candidatus Caenarcaniphilales bacterium]